MKRKLFFVLLMIASLVMLMGCSSSKNSIYNNQLVKDVGITKIENEDGYFATNYYVVFSVNGEEKKYMITGNNRKAISDEIKNHLKSSGYNGIDPKFNLIVDDQEKLIRAIGIVGKSKGSSLE